MRAAQAHKIAPPQVTDDPVLVDVLEGRAPTWRGRCPRRSTASGRQSGVLGPASRQHRAGTVPRWRLLAADPGTHAARTHGRYITTISALTGDEKDGAVQARIDKFKARWADRSVYGDITYAPLGKATTELAPAGTVDLVLTAWTSITCCGSRVLWTAWASCSQR
jgi:hypothetical protein